MLAWYVDERRAGSSRPVKHVTYEPQTDERYVKYLQDGRRTGGA